MSKKLVLMRHAKAAEGVKDFERKLTKEGMRQAAAIAELIRAEFNPQVVLTSEAERALETARIVSRELNCLDLVKTNADLYDGGVRDYMKIVDAEMRRFDRAILIAHNPSLSDLCALLGDNWTKILTPSAALGLEFERGAAEGGGKEIFYFEPK